MGTGYTYAIGTRQRSVQHEPRENVESVRRSIRDDPINQPIFSVNGVGGGAQVPALPCVSLWAGRDPLLLQLDGPEKRGGRIGWKGDREIGGGGRLGPYILSSPERVAIISRQWPADRSASQKDRGPIIAATHRPPRFGRFASPPFLLLPPSVFFYFPSPPPANSFCSLATIHKPERSPVLSQETKCF